MLSLFLFLLVTATSSIAPCVRCSYPCSTTMCMSEDCFLAEMHESHSHARPCQVDEKPARYCRWVSQRLVPARWDFFVRCLLFFLACSILLVSIILFPGVLFHGVSLVLPARPETFCWALGAVISSTLLPLRWRLLCDKRSFKFQSGEVWGARV